MSERSVDRLVADILERIARIKRHVGNISRESFENDDKTIDAVVRNLEVIGEPANRIPPEFRERHPEIPWRRIVGLRNRIVHEYFDVDLALVWEIIARELSLLEAQLIELQRTIGDS